MKCRRFGTKTSALPHLPPGLSTQLPILTHAEEIFDNMYVALVNVSELSSECQENCV